MGMFLCQRTSALQRVDPCFSSRCSAFGCSLTFFFNVLLVQTFEYKKLILDYSRDVRRATHDVMTNVVTGVGFVFLFSAF